MDVGGRVGGKYRLLRRVAVGGMGEIWRARNEATGADVALKVLRRDADAVMGARLRSEARLGATLTHRNIVRIFDLLEEPDGSLVLVMEFLRGESLAHLLERRRTLPQKEAIAVMVPVLSALAHAHESGIVHRDVTPANIFLATDPDGHVAPKLVDFGIAKLPAASPGAGSQTLPGSVLGTPRYMSPEQIRAVEELDGRSDLFSAAAVLYEMLTGISPFDAPTPSASLALVLESPVDPDPLIEPRVWVEIARALAKRPYGRHAGAKELADALLSAVSESETSLAAQLKRDPPGREEVDVEGVDEQPSQRVTSVAGQSLDARRRPLSRSLWLLGLAGVAGIAVAIGSTNRRPTRAVDAPVPQVAASIPEAPSTSVTPVPAATTSTPAEPDDLPSTSASPRQVRAPPAKPQTRLPPRPAARAPAASTSIATTPGF
jgi:eukaryotic-like serine/threonine-protein kinase